MWLILLRAEAKQYGFKKGPWFLNWSHTSGSHVTYYKREEGGVKSVTIPIRLLNLKPDFVASSGFERETLGGGKIIVHCLPQEKE